MEVSERFLQRRDDSRGFVLPGGSYSWTRYGCKLQKVREKLVTELRSSDGLERLQNVAQNGTRTEDGNSGETAEGQCSRRYNRKSEITGIEHRRRQEHSRYQPLINIVFTIQNKQQKFI